MCDQQSLRSACANAQSDQSLCKSLEYSVIVKLLTEHHLEFLSFKGGCTGSYESTLVKMPHCWKSHIVVQMLKLMNMKILTILPPNFLLIWVYEKLPLVCQGSMLTCLMWCVISKISPKLAIAKNLGPLT